MARQKYLQPKIDETTISRAEIADCLCSEFQGKISYQQAMHLTNSFFEIIAQALQDGRDVRLGGFGSFDISRKSRRPGRDIRAQKMVMIPARRVVTFHASKLLNDRVSDACTGKFLVEE